MAASVSVRRHEALRQGARLGLLIAAGIWVWIAAIDAIAGEPFRTFAVFGGIVTFTAAHCLLNMGYGVVIVTAIRGASRAPSLVIAALVAVVMLEIAITMATILLAETALGALAWIQILGGSLVGVAIAFIFLARRYPLLSLLRSAEHET